MSSRPRTGEWFAILPSKAVFDRNLTDGELRALAAVAAHAGPDRICKTPQGTLAKKLGVPRQSMNRWLRGLERKGYLERVGQVRRRDGSATANIYRITGYSGSRSLMEASQGGVAETSGATLADEQQFSREAI